MRTYARIFEQCPVCFSYCHITWEELTGTQEDAVLRTCSNCHWMKWSLEVTWGKE